MGDGLYVLFFFPWSASFCAPVHVPSSETSDEFRHRSLAEAGPFTFVAAAALTMKVPEGGRVINTVLLVATGVSTDGRREVLGLEVATNEIGPAWNAFFADLVAPGVTGVQLVTSDAHAGLKDAIAANLPGASWQCWRTPYSANLQSALPKSTWPAVEAMLHGVYDQPDAPAVNAPFDRTPDYVAEKLPKVAEHFDTARADILAFTAFTASPKDLLQQIWSNNPNERVNREIRRRTVPGREHRPGAHPSASSPTETRSSASSAESSPSRPMNG